MTMSLVYLDYFQRFGFNDFRGPRLRSASSGCIHLPTAWTSFDQRSVVFYGPQCGKISHLLCATITCQRTRSSGRCIGLSCRTLMNTIRLRCAVPVILAPCTNVTT